MNWVVFATFLAATLVVAYGRFCNTAADCDTGYCCVASSASRLRSRGVCVRLARNNRRCSEDESQLSYFGDKYVLYCPCADGFVCKPKNLRAGSTMARCLASLRCQTEAAAQNIAGCNGDTTNPPNTATPAPETPAPETPAPETPAPETPAPETPAPETPAPETPAPETPAPTDPTDPPATIGEGPGGEPPRDDDCENWEYPC